MFRATEEIMEAFEDAGFRFRTEENPKNTLVRAGYRSSSGVTADVLFVSCDDDADVAVRVPSLARVPEEKVPAMLQVLNTLNRRYRYAKFVLDDDHDIDLEYDFLQRTDNIGALAVETFRVMMRIIDSAAPDIMKAIWAN